MTPDERRSRLRLALQPLGLAEIIGRTVRLKAYDIDGGPSRGCCSFHPDSARGLYVGEDGWHCFSCRASGDAVDWVMQRDSLDEAAALHMLEAATGTREA